MGLAVLAVVAKVVDKHRGGTLESVNLLNVDNIVRTYQLSIHMKIIIIGTFAAVSTG